MHAYSSFSFWLTFLNLFFVNIVTFWQAWFLVALVNLISYIVGSMGFTSFNLGVLLWHLQRLWLKVLFVGVILVYSFCWLRNIWCIFCRTFLLLPIQTRFLLWPISLSEFFLIVTDPLCCFASLHFWAALFFV